MQKNFRDAIMRAAAFVRGRLEPKLETGGIPIGQHVYVGPMVPTSLEQQKAGMRPWMVFPVEMRHRERNKYGPKPPAIGARQLARARLGGFAGKPKEVISREIEIARWELASETFEPAKPYGMGPL
jgi:hypothetical protein